MVNTPVLFITFARPEYARESWNAIKAARPKSLYFYSNKGRKEKEGEIEKNEEIRSYVKEIDWDCNLHTWFRDETVDVYTSLRGAISWLFENEEQGIVLEEDCVATMAFFDYCDQLLNKYKDDQKVWLISGDNYLGKSPCGESYFITRHFQIYGWATWRNRWKQTNWNLENVKEFINSKEYRDYWVNAELLRNRKKKIYKKYNFLKQTYCWDEIFYITMEQNRSYCIFPQKHLVTNIGLSGSHNQNNEKKIWNIEADKELSQFVIARAPDKLLPNEQFDYLFFKLLHKESFIRQLLSNIHYIFVRYINHIN